jgi:hypothetical protein
MMATAVSEGSELGGSCEPSDNRNCWQLPQKKLRIKINRTRCLRRQDGEKRVDSVVERLEESYNGYMDSRFRLLIAGILSEANRSCWLLWSGQQSGRAVGDGGGDSSGSISPAFVEGRMAVVGLAL